MQLMLETVTASDKDAELFTTAPDADDERGEWTPEELEAEEAAQIEAVTAAAEADSPRDANAERLWRREQTLLDQMQAIAEKNRHLPDAKIAVFDRLDPREFMSRSATFRQAAAGRCR